MWNASRFCVSSLRRGHANLLCIVPILVYVLPKLAHLSNYLFQLLTNPASYLNISWNCKHCSNCQRTKSNICLLGWLLRNNFMYYETCHWIWMIIMKCLSTWNRLGFIDFSWIQSYSYWYDFFKRTSNSRVHNSSKNNGFHAIWLHTAASSKKIC